MYIYAMVIYIYMYICMYIHPFTCTLRLYNWDLPRIPEVAGGGGAGGGGAAGDLGPADPGVGGGQSLQRTQIWSM